MITITDFSAAGLYSYFVPKSHNRVVSKDLVELTLTNPKGEREEGYINKYILAEFIRHDLKNNTELSKQPVALE